MTKLAKDLTYRQAMDELKRIVERLREAEDVDVDELLRDVSRAKALIDFCGSRIHHADVQIQNVLQGLRSAEDGTPPENSDQDGGRLFP